MEAVYFSSDLLEWLDANLAQSPGVPLSQEQLKHLSDAVEDSTVSLAFGVYTECVNIECANIDRDGQPLLSLVLCSSGPTRRWLWLR